MEQAPAAPPKLAFGATFSAAFSAVFGHLWMFVKAALLPLALGIVIAVLSLVLLVEIPVLLLPLEILEMVPFVILGIACSRLVLIGRQAGAIPRPLFGRRTLVYFGYTWLFLLMIALPLGVSFYAMIGSTVLSIGSGLEIPNLQSVAPTGPMVLSIFVLFFVLMYLATRFSLVFPAVSVDQKLGLGGSWRLTRGSGLKLYAVLIVITILTVVCTLVAMLVFNSLIALLWFQPETLSTESADVDWVSFAISKAPTWIGSLLLEYLSFALIIAAVAKAYAHLSGWGAPRAEILERFE